MSKLSAGWTHSGAWATVDILNGSSLWFLLTSISLFGNTRMKYGVLFRDSSMLDAAYDTIGILAAASASCAASDVDEHAGPMRTCAPDCTMRLATAVPPACEQGSTSRNTLQDTSGLVNKGTERDESVCGSRCEEQRVRLRTARVHWRRNNSRSSLEKGILSPLSDASLTESAHSYLMQHRALSPLLPAHSHKAQNIGVDLVSKKKGKERKCEEEQEQQIGHSERNRAEPRITSTKSPLPFSKHQGRLVHFQAAAEFSQRDFRLSYIRDVVQDRHASRLCRAREQRAAEHTDCQPHVRWMFYRIEWSARV